MKDLVGAAYWVLIGALMVPVLYFTSSYPVLLLGGALWVATRRLTDAGRAV